MKRAIICIALLSILALSACSAIIGNNHSLITDQPSENMEKNSIAWEKHGHQALESSSFLQYSLSANEGMTIELPEIGLENLVVRRKVSGSTTESMKHYLSTYIISDYRYRERVWHDSYLAIETGDKILLYDFQNRSLDDFLYLCDVDGDGIDEIIVQQTVGMSGGAGSYESFVFKVVEGEIKALFMSSIPNSSDNGSSRFDTGFSSELKDGFKLEISNRFTGYTTTFDFSAEKKYLGRFFDDSGIVISSTNILCDSFYVFTPEDIDDDGVFELVCVQYVSLDGHANSIGYAKSILKFNPSSQEFEVIFAEFFL